MASRPYAFPQWGCRWAREVKLPPLPWAAVWHSGEGLIWESGAGVVLSSCHHLPAVCPRTSPGPPFLKWRECYKLPWSGTGTQGGLSQTVDVKMYSQPGMDTSQAGSEPGVDTIQAPCVLGPVASSNGLQQLPASPHEPLHLPSPGPPPPSHPQTLITDSSAIRVWRNIRAYCIPPLGYREVSPKPPLGTGKSKGLPSCPHCISGTALSGSTAVN